MSTSVKVLCAGLMIWLSMASAAAAQRSSVENRYSSIWPEDCVITGSGGDEMDYVDYRCAGEGQDVELHFHDGVRLSISFAPDLMLYGLREKNWPVEWLRPPRSHRQNVSLSRRV